MHDRGSAEQYLKQLRKRRQIEYWNQIIPHLRYVLQSGVLTLLVLSGIVFFAYYASLLQNVPDDLPIRYITWIALLPFLIYSPFRTYVQQADVVYLLPLESKMGSYFRGSWLSAAILQSIVTSVVFIVLWPLYFRADADPRPFIVLWAAWLGLKWMNNYGNWQERAMNRTVNRHCFRWLRWILTAGLIGIWLWIPAWRACLFSMLVVLTYVLALRIPDKQKVPWERLIQVEQQQIHRNILLMNWFVDFPGLSQRVHRRSWLAWVGNHLKFEPSSAYLYLYSKSFARSDLFGIVIRLCGVAILFLWWRQSSTWIGLLYLLFLFFIGVQLAGLKQFHKYSLWRSIYPLPERMSTEAAMKVARQAHLITAIVLWLPLLFAPQSWVYRGLVLLGGILFVYIFQLVWSRRQS